MKNSYFLKGKNGENAWWRYLVMIILVIIASGLGSFPYSIIIGIKAINQGVTIDPGDFSSVSQIEMDKNLGLFLLALSFVIALIAFIVFLKPFHNKSLKDTLTGRNKFDIKRFFFAVFVWGSLTLITFFIGYLIDPDNYILQINIPKLIGLILISGIFITMQAAFEEILFRGYFQQGIALLSKNAWIPLIITSVLFGLAHISNPEVKEYGVGIMLPQYILLGLMLGICVVMDEGLEIPIGVHVINNVLGSILVTHESSVLQTNAIFRAKQVDPQYAFYEIIVLSVVFLAIMAYKYKWESFKKLFAKLEL